MALTPGIRLGPYEIVSALGAGGMGEVYRARDTRLDRTVAVKILSPLLSEDPILRQRFEREAKAISSLNHPHICILHDVGHQDGTDFLVMEYLEGETLSKRLDKGPLPLAQALKYGVEIADALDKAHRSGVIHRDLKPGNIMLTTSGAKLLDFGLAKAAVPLAAGATLTAVATRSTPVTQRGTIVGTFQYMSPEQIEGKDVDARTDIFSFGSLLYEMVTGKRAFPGKSQLSVASAILEKDPEPISTLQPLAPRALDHAIRLCLAKDSEERWQTARDLLLELKWITEAGSQAEVTAPVISHWKLRERLAWVAAGALGIALAGAAVGWWRTDRTAALATPLIRLEAELSPGAMIDRFRGAWLALSPDGTRIAVAESDPSGKWRLVARSLDQSQFAPLFGADRGRAPFFSADSQWIAFFADGKLKKIPVQGGTSVTLCDAPGFPRGASWGDDGNIVAAFNDGATGLVKVPSGGGAPTTLTQLSKENGETAHGWPQVLLGGQAVLFTAYRGGSFDDGEIVFVSLKTGERKTVYRGGFFGRYLSSGHLVFLRQNTLFAAPFDLKRLALTAVPQPVIEEVNSTVRGGGDFDSSRNGTVVYVSSKGPSSDRQIAWLDSTGQTKPLQETPGHYEGPRFSPDGKRLAIELAAGPVQADIWVKDLERDTMSRLTHLPGRSNVPLWTPDGRGIVFITRYHEAPGIYWVRADGTGEPQLLMGVDGKMLFPSSISPDGKRLAYTQFYPDGRVEIWTAPVEGDSEHPRLGKPEAFLQTSFSESHPVFSPDGRWLAYASNESGTEELYVRSFPGPGGKVQISTGGGSYPIWSRKEHKLYFLTADWRIMVLDYSVNGDSFVPGKPQMWSSRSLIYMGGLYPYDLASDGKRFAVLLDAAGAEQEQKRTESVVVLMNFFEELRRKVPTGKN
jgi:Tol biopolymer transport system component